MKSMIMISTKIMTNTIIIVLIIHQVQSQLMTCPQVCSCIWRNGKQTTICENQNLISIPNQISQSTQVLDLNQNNFQILPSKAFQERGLINLQKLFIPKCKLGAIADDAFYQLTNLVELDLSDNLLTHVPIKALANATNLRRLLLNNNHIATITAESFTSLSSLKFLNLSGCKTHTIEARAFYGLRDLEYLYLHDNKLTTLPYAVVSDLPALYSFELYRNPWQCNCEMRPTREWMIRNNVGQSIPATCDLPIRLSGLMWNSLDIDDFACEPDIITTTVEVAKVVGSNATLSCTVKGIPEPKVFWYLDHGSYNISSQRSNKYHLHEERSEGIINSLLTIINLDNSDDSTSFICSAENRAGIKSKNFTVYVLQSGAFMVPSNWSKIELAGSILGLLLTLVVAFVLITLILIRSKRLPFYGVCSNKKSSESSRNNSNKGNNSPMDSLEKKKSLNQLFAQHFHQNGTAIHPATNTNGTSITYQQHALSMLGIDGIDKKPEIFLKPDLLVPGTLDNNNKMDNNNQSNIMINGNNNLTGYEMNHFNTNHNQINGHLTFSNDVLNGNQDTLFVNNEESVPNFQHQQQQMSGLYRAVMVNPTTVITDNNVNGGLALSSSTTMTTANAPQTNSSIMTYNTSTTANATPPPVIMNNLQSQPNLLFAATTPTATQYLSQFELNNQLVPPQSNAQFYTQQQSLPNQNRQTLPDSSPSPLLISYGNPAFISDSAASINGFICMDTNNNNSNMNNATTTMMYNDMNGDDDEVFRATINKPIILEPLPSLFTQLPSRPNTTATMITNNNSLSRPNLLAMEESLYGIRRTTIPTPINPIQQPSFVTMAPMQMAPPAPTINQQQQSIYGITTANSSKSRWQTMTPNFPFRNQQPYPSMTATTSLSNIRYSPDEGYGEESSTGGSAGNSGAAAANNNNGATVGQLQGTEV